MHVRLCERCRSATALMVWMVVWGGLLGCSVRADNYLRLIPMFGFLGWVFWRSYRSMAACSKEDTNDV